MKSTKSSPNPEMRKNSAFTRSMIYQCLKNNKIIKELSTGENGHVLKHGLDKVLEYMVRSDFLNQLDTVQIVANGGDSRMKNV